MKAIIPTGGRGTRMQPLTFSTNKQFISVANKPLVHYPIEAVASAGISDIAITYAPGWLEYIKEKLGTGKRWGVKFTYILQEKPIGLANIFQVCEEYMGSEPFLMHLGDNIFVDGISDLVAHFKKEKPNGMIAKIKHPENWRLGVPIFDKKGRLKDYVEKPKRPPNEYAVPGIYFFDNNVFDCFKGKDKIKPSRRGEYEILEPYKWLIKKGFRVDVTEYKGRWLDPGKFNDWIEANEYLLDKKLKPEIKVRLGKSIKVRGRVSIGKGSKFTNSELRGPTIIGEKVSVKGSYIGPYTSVGDGCTIENSHVENSVIMPGVTIKNVKQPIDESLIGADTSVVDEDGPTDCLKLFVGEKCEIKI